MDPKINQYEVLPVEPLKLEPSFPYGDQEVEKLLFKNLEQDQKQQDHLEQLEFRFG